MAEIYQTPSLNFNQQLTPPESLIPQAPSGQNSSLDALMALAQVLPPEAYQQIVSQVLTGTISPQDVFNAVLGPQGSELQGGLSQQALINNLTTGSPLTQPQVSNPQASANAPGNAPNAASPTSPAEAAARARFTFDNPFFTNVTSPILNEQGQQIGTTNLANNQFATPGMANGLLNYLASTYGLNNGRVVTSQYSGPTAPSQAELGIQFGNSPIINAGLEYQRLQNPNGYSQQYLDAQFKDTLQPGSSGWSNYANGGQAMTSADAERLYAGNPNTDPNVNAMGRAWKNAELNAWNPQWQNNNQQPTLTAPAAPTQYQRPTMSRTQPSYNNMNWGNWNNQPGMRSFTGNTGFNNYASAINRRPVHGGYTNTRSNF